MQYIICTHTSGLPGHAPLMQGEQAKKNGLLESAQAAEADLAHLHSAGARGIDNRRVDALVANVRVPRILAIGTIGER